MKKTFLFLGFFFLVITTVYSQNIVINCRIDGQKKGKITYTKNIDGVPILNFIDSTRIDSLGNFKISLESKSPTFTRISFEDDYVFLFIQPNKTYNLAVNYSNFSDFKMKDEDFEGQKYLNELKRRNTRDLKLLGLYFNIINPNKLQHAIFEKKQEEINKVNKLKISAVFKTYLNRDIDYYYSSLIVNTINYQFYRFKSDTITLNNNDKNQLKDLAKNIYLSYQVKDSIAIKLSAWLDYALAYNEYRNNSDLSLDSIDGIYHEILSAQYINNGLRIIKPNKNILDKYVLFINQYPKSRFIECLQPKINELNKFYEIKLNDSIKNYSFINNSESYKTLNDLLNLFKGKSIFIDIWATWCAPCILEFEYSSKLEAFLKSQNIELLYISIDNENNDSIWMRSIVYHNLKGYHIRANKALIEDLKTKYKKSSSMGIPWYMIVNSQGRIVVNHANRPSSESILYEQIKNELKK